MVNPYETIKVTPTGLVSEVIQNSSLLEEPVKMLDVTNLAGDVVGSIPASYTEPTVFIDEMKLLQASGGVLGDNQGTIINPITDLPMTPASALTNIWISQETHKTRDIEKELLEQDLGSQIVGDDLGTDDFLDKDFFNTINYTFTPPPVNVVNEWYESGGERVADEFNIPISFGGMFGGLGGSFNNLFNKLGIGALILLFGLFFIYRKT